MMRLSGAFPTEALTSLRLLCTGGNIYLANHNGVLRCFDFKTGEKIYEERLGADAVCQHRWSRQMVKFIARRTWHVHVIKAGHKLEVLAKNEMGEPCLATPRSHRE